jgi:hypothetical protein
MKIRKCKSSCKNCKGADCTDIIPFRLFYKWECYTGFAYDGITDEEITNGFSYIKYCDIEREWQEDTNLYETDKVPIELKHATRIAALVLEIEEGKGIDPVYFDTYAHKSPSGISDGNHRIRALQYIKSEYFPASLSGVVTELNKFRRKYHRHKIEIV